MKYRTLSVTPHAFRRWQERVLGDESLLLQGVEPEELLPHMKFLKPNRPSVWDRFRRPGQCYADFEGQVLFIMQSRTRQDFALITVFTKNCMGFLKPLKRNRQDGRRWCLKRR